MNPSWAALALVALPAALQAADLDFAAMKRASAKVADPQAAAVDTRPTVLSGGVDMTDFLRRLEDMTLDTTVLRGLLGHIDVSFRPPTGSANAQYGQIMNQLYLPDTLKAAGRNAVRYDLSSNELNTVIHELTHAAADHLASGNEPFGSAGGDHHRALGMISTQVRGGSLLARYPNTKADELAGYYMGCAIADVADTITFLRVYNNVLAKPADRAEAERLGGRVLGFDEKTGGPSRPVPESWTSILHRPLGHCTVGDSAQFEGSTIGVEPDFATKGLLFQSALGLKPPLSERELVKRLNDPARASAGINELRREVYEARLKNVR